MPTFSMEFNYQGQMVAKITGGGIYPPIPRIGERVYVKNTGYCVVKRVSYDYSPSSHTEILVDLL